MGEENWLRILLRSTHRVTRRVGSLSHSISSFFSPSLFSVVSVLLCANSTVTTNQLSDLKTCTQKIDFQRQFNLMLFSLVAFPAVWCFPSENIDCAIARCFGLLPSENVTLIFQDVLGGRTNSGHPLADKVLCIQQVREKGMRTVLNV